MARIHIHQGGGCEAIVREEGNELTDKEVRQYLCPNKAVEIVTFDAGFTKSACQEHADKWRVRFTQGKK